MRTVRTTVFLGLAILAGIGIWPVQERKAFAADVYLLNADGKVWKNGAYAEDLSTGVKIPAVGIGCSAKMKAVPILEAGGPIYTNRMKVDICIPFKIEAAAVAVVGLEIYVLDGGKGEVWRYFREGPGKGEWKREESKSDRFKRKALSIAVVGPETDKVDRKVYLLIENGKVLVDGQQDDSLSPSAGMVKPRAIAADGGNVYLLEGSNGKVFRNGKHDEKLSTSVFVECVGFAVKDGTSYVLTKDGAVYVNGKKDPAVSSNVKSDFVSISVK